MTPICPPPPPVVVCRCHLPPPCLPIAAAAICSRLPLIATSANRRHCRPLSSLLSWPLPSPSLSSPSLSLPSPPSTTPPPRDLFDCCVYHHRICDRLLLLRLCLVATIIPLANVRRQVGGGNERSLPDHPSIHCRPSHRRPHCLHHCHRAVTVIVDVVVHCAVAIIVIVPPISIIKGEGKYLCRLKKCSR